MKSPFPGMDPYLEQYWGDVHHRLITYACDQIQPALPADLRARVEERVFLERDGEGYRVVYPDVHVAEQPAAKPGEAPSAGTAVQEPLIIHVSDEPLTQGFLEIIDASSGNRVVTVIEFVSPTNKIDGPGRELYIQKQREVVAAQASLVEIDLTRQGRRVFSFSPEYIPPKHRTTYHACVRRAGRLLQAEIYKGPLRERLPAIRIPLRPTDSDVPLDLQALIDLCYRNGRYDNINYRLEPHPPLEPDDAAWADQLLRSHGLR